MEYVPLLAFLALLLGLAAVAAGVWPEFVLTVADGVVSVSKGKAPPQFVEDVREVLADCSVRRGTIKAVRKVWGVGLVFSRDIPAGCRQRLRNVWAMRVLAVRRRRRPS